MVFETASLQVEITVQSGQQLRKTIVPIQSPHEHHSSQVNSLIQMQDYALINSKTERTACNSTTHLAAGTQLFLKPIRREDPALETEILPVRNRSISDSRSRVALLFLFFCNLNPSRTRFLTIEVFRCRFFQIR
ncbi:hypothetical protein AVEN_138429-1 [Araneus ventricosus]|uniref:Uncharacterized protein n=1 Tax=Araneus ventricosus TaxID=182803 RepID=A0A4Y2LKM4_ARAVE|nr:hypothetical protein AVEN_138429-1 [Araneus ventricosus]